MNAPRRLRLAEDVLADLADDDYRGNPPASLVQARSYFSEVERLEADETAREELLDLGPMIHPARKIRFRKLEDFDDLTVAELEQAETRLRALSYSCAQAAGLLLRARQHRTDELCPHGRADRLNCDACAVVGEVET